MRKAIVGVGIFLIIVGLVQLILSITLVGGVKGQVKGIDEQIDVVVEDVSGTLTGVADALDNSVEYLGTLDATLADADASLADATGIVTGVADALDDSVEYLGTLDATLVDVGKPISDVTDVVMTTQYTTAWLVQQWWMRVTADDIDYWAYQLEYVGWDASWLRDWANYLRSEGLVLKVSEKDVTQVFTPVTENLELASSSISGARGFLTTAKTDLRGIGDSVSAMAEGITEMSEGIKGVGEFLTTAKADLSGIGDNMRTMAADIEGIKGVDISGAVTGVIGWLQIYMIISSVLFMAVGAGLFLVGMRRAVS